MRTLLSLLIGGSLLLATVWAFGAINIDGPFASGTANLSLAVVWFAAITTALVFLPKRRRKFFAWFLGIAVVAIPWSRIEPSNDRDWKADWRKTGWTTIEGDVVTLYEFRNFDYTLDGSVLENWERRTVHLSNLKALDYFHVPFGGDLIAHPLLSFDFGEDGHVVLSIETRREVGESYSEIGGLYKMFELQYLFGDERDLIRVRSNLREEPVHLYRAALTREQAKTIFLESVAVQNQLKEQPRWYNVITANCTTSLRAQTAAERRDPFDIRLLANGRLDELFYERNVLVSGKSDSKLPFEDLREQALINEDALEAHDAPNFSERIREGRIGF